MRAFASCTVFLMLAVAAHAQQSPSVVSMAPATTVSAVANKTTPFELDFRIAQKFHINSNKPNSDLLIPTALKLSPPTDILISAVTYPEGDQIAFEFAPAEKLSVYSGDFSIRGKVRPLRSVKPGTYRVHGSLKYQACDNRACFPPKSLPIQFDVRVGKPAPTNIRRNPAQSPHIHK